MMGLMGMMGVGMGWTADNGHPRELLLFMGCLCNVFFRWYVIVAKNARRTHIEGTKKGERMRECVNLLMR